MIEKMRFLSITGPKSDFDRVVNKYLSKYEIHLENALNVLSSSYELKPFIESNPYKELIDKSNDLIGRFDRSKVPAAKPATNEELMPADEATEIINSAYAMLTDLSNKENDLKKQRQECNDLLIQIEHFRQLDYDIHQIINFKFIKYRFGKIPAEFYTRLSKSIFDNLNTIFYECDRDKDNVWGIYFVPADYTDRIDAIYASLHFERIKLPDAYYGTPEESYQSIKAKMAAINKELDELNKKIKEQLNTVSEKLFMAHHTVTVLSESFDVRKLAACTRQKDKGDVFYILCGWISQKDSEKLLKEAEKDPLVYCVCNDNYDENEIKPPTKLKNPSLFKPFEMFIKMYGLPAYNEIDPTLFVAITYSFMFGVMFGDVGQGLCLLIGGLLIYRFKKMNLAAIIALAGIFSTLFGFMYGSIFGFETVLKPVWLSPSENVMTVLITSISFGVFLILTAMFFNIVNGIKAKDWGKVLFDTNGIAGLVFYAALISSVVLIYTGHSLPGTLILVIFFGIPLLLMFLKEPLTHLVEKKAHIFPEHKAMFFLESFFELFEVLLSYLTNTISFLRVGAFALSHAGMMAVVIMLSGAEQGGSPNIFVLVLGNVFVCLLEGLIVGIQVLRLEYYEMFSRFYKGDGKEFKPYKCN